MRASIARLLLALAAIPAFAAEEGASRSGGQGEAGRAVAKSAYIPPVEPDAAQNPRVPLGNLKPGGSCGRSEFEVCLDPSGRISVPGAKRFLPGLPGMKPEKLTVRRSGVVFSYSF
jgi:hypothetical protein